MSRFLHIALAPGLLMLAAGPAFADGTTPDLSTIDLVQSTIATALDTIFNSLSSICVKWLGGLLVLQMVWTQIMGMLSGSAELERSWGKLAAGIMWAGFCLFIFENGADFIRSMANYLLNLAAGLTGQPFTPTYPITTGLASASNLLNAFDKGQSILGMLNPFPAIMMGLVALVILATCTVIAFRIFMISVETKIVIALSPISFALMGLNALRDQGFAPIKYLIAMGYRVLVLGAVLAAMTTFSAALMVVFQNLPASSSSSVWPPVWAAAIGYSLLGALAWNANSIAAHLASGSSSMTSADLGGPAAMAAAVGGAVGAAVGNALGDTKNAISKLTQSMSDWKKEGGMEIKNGSGAGGPDQLGLGQVPKPDFTPSSPTFSMGDEGGPRADDSKPDGGPEKTTPAPDDNNKSLEDHLKQFQPDAQPGERKDAARDAAREARRQARQSGGLGDNASIGGANPDAGSGAPSSPKTGKSVMDHLHSMHDHASRNQAPAVHVTLNTHQGE